MPANQASGSGAPSGGMAAGRPAALRIIGKESFVDSTIKVSLSHRDGTNQPNFSPNEMRRSWVVGRAVPPVRHSLGEGECPPHDGRAMLTPLPMPDGGQRTARPANQD